MKPKPNPFLNDDPKLIKALENSLVLLKKKWNETSESERNNRIDWIELMKDIEQQLKEYEKRQSI